VPVVVAEPKEFGERSCPKCAKPVDERAVFCTHCRETIARHVACPHCQESRVPDDLELCWKCRLPMHEDEQIDCPQCFTWRGSEDQFPCPNCGYDPKAPVSAAADAPTLVIERRPEPAQPAATIEIMQPTVEALPEPFPATVPVPLVQCTTCYANVEPGPRCSVCKNVLELR
jgi:hypothetical protein